MNKKTIISIAILIFFSLGVVAWLIFTNIPKKEVKSQATSKSIDGFAKCLKEKGVVMYGAYWCSHCQRQKKLFGDSFKYVTYVECTKDVKKCREKKIEGYPTWIFKNGERIAGEATFEELSEKIGCKAP